ncbi:hypothetical protein CALVIDRAFT_460364, partial [Calocera viscosa TUFC12733]
RQPLPFFFPTGGNFVDSKHGITYSWSSRSSRKNRSPPARHHVEPHPDAPVRGPTPRLSRAGSIEARLQKSPFKPHLEADCSFWVAVIFTAGSAVWVINGFLVFLPILQPSVPLYANAAGALAFVGGTLFEAGGWLMVVEASNTGHEQMFSGPLNAYLRWYRPSEEKLLDAAERAQDEDDQPQQEEGKAAPGALKHNSDMARFVWFAKPAWRDLGYLASFIQFIAATIFWVATVTGLPGVIPTLFTDPPVVVADIFYWTPQVVGGFGFVVSSVLLMIETQKHWYLPNPLSIGWQVAVWNLVGAVGFLLCGAWGYLSLDEEWQNYQSACATFWGSWAFLIGSVFQLYETIWRE